MTLTEFLLARIAEDEAAARDHEFGRLSEDGWLPKQVGPTRVLAECEAKRRIVELHAAGGALDGCRSCGTLRLVAMPYADHPNYRDEWKP